MTFGDERPGAMWFRRDLRLTDNPAWAAASSAHDRVVALFVLEPALLDRAGSVRRDQLIAHLRALDEQLRDLGGHLVLRTGPAAEAVPSVLAESDAAALYLNDDVTPFAVSRDAATLATVSVPVHRFHGNTVHAPGSILTRRGTLSQVFGAFHEVWAATDPPPWPEPGECTPVSLATEPIPSAGSEPRQAGGETSAWTRLTDWLESVDDYHETRDRPAIDGTSDLSTDLKFGTVAARTVLDVVGASSPGRAAFARQLAWRDWWAHTLAEHPDLADRALRSRYEGIEWRADDEGFRRWCEGRTGYPIVDAGMRQLVATGWMHNRVRMVCASFLVKDLLIDWRRGERFFRHHLVDADPAQNAGNWQWVAGTGPDAAPYFRIFNPTTQGEKFDPDGYYVRRWVPELADLPAGIIHEPSSAGPLDLAAAGVTIGDTYPTPIVDHRSARIRTMAAYRAVDSVDPMPPSSPSRPIDP